MKKVLPAVIALAAMVLTAPAWGQGGPGPGGPRPMGGACPAMAVMTPPSQAVDRIAGMLQLTDDQVTKLKTVLTTGEQTTKTLAQKAGDATKALRGALQATEYDVQSVKTLAAAAEKAESALVDARIDIWTQMRAILTADQVKQFQGMGGPRGPGGQRTEGQRPEGADNMPPPPGE